jgi:hypothetical protein
MVPRGAQGILATSQTKGEDGVHVSIIMYNYVGEL